MDNLEMVNKAIRIAMKGGVGVTFDQDEIKYILDKIDNLKAENEALRKRLEALQLENNNMQETGAMLLDQMLMWMNLYGNAKWMYERHAKVLKEINKLTANVEGDNYKLKQVLQKINDLSRD